MNVGNQDKNNGGWDFNGLDTGTFRSFETDQEDYIYDLEPQSNNLFFVCNFAESTGDKIGSSYKELFNAQFRARSIQLPRLEFTFTTDPVTHLPLFDSGKFDFNVQIDWLDDVYHSIWHYHENWMARWYNYQFNLLRCGQDGKFRKCRVVAYHYKKKGDVFNPEVEAEPLYIMNIFGMVPRALEGLRQSYEEDGGDKLLSMQYIASKVDILFNSNFTKKGDNNVYDSTSKATGVGTAVWNPQTMSNGESDISTFERLRITRAVTQRFGASQLEVV